MHNLLYVVKLQLFFSVSHANLLVSKQALKQCIYNNFCKKRFYAPKNSMKMDYCAVQINSHEICISNLLIVFNYVEMFYLHHIVMLLSGFGITYSKSFFSFFRVVHYHKQSKTYEIIGSLHNFFLETSC